MLNRWMRNMEPPRLVVASLGVGTLVALVTFGVLSSFGDSSAPAKPDGAVLQPVAAAPPILGQSSPRQGSPGGTPPAVGDIAVEGLGRLASESPPALEIVPAVDNAPADEP